MQQRLELGQPCSGFATAEDGFTEQIDVRIPPGASLLGEVAFEPGRFGRSDEMTDDAPHTSMGERHDEAWDGRSQPRAGAEEETVDRIVYEPLAFPADEDVQPPVSVSAAARAFCERLLQRHPDERPTAAEALADPWLADDEE